uniref:No apical meristem-associated C-terminal domain-containing protein n=1 Tax=Brassica oleracea TaxID=3712 RepID=A0A3P6BCD9_BRAOL|nr:unnamed protein product [Brassica oleracea]
MKLSLLVETKLSLFLLDSMYRGDGALLDGDRAIFGEDEALCRRSQQNSGIGLESSLIPLFGTQATEASNFEQDTPVERKERRSWMPTDDVVLISSWLNTSKDVVVRNEQTKRETLGQNENDILKQAHVIFFNNYKKKITLEPAWKELRHVQKWCDLSTKRTSKKRKCEDGAQSSTSQATDNNTSEADEGTDRPPGVKAAKRRGKKPMEEGKGLCEFEQMWSIKQEDLSKKERLSKIGLLDRLLAKTEPLPESVELFVICFMLVLCCLFHVHVNRGNIAEHLIVVFCHGKEEAAYCLVTIRSIMYHSLSCKLKFCSLLV